ncbi:retrovirus poly protein [Rutstroemia sp. NJR-2017a BVV2]|nr:retrovirus poly protein [Rutstroemia sp. NJR-2017a BVV2]
MERIYSIALLNSRSLNKDIRLYHYIDITEAGIKIINTTYRSYDKDRARSQTPYTVNTVEYWEESNEEEALSDTPEDQDPVVQIEQKALPSRLRDIRYLDLTKLIGGEYIITFCTLAKNGLSFPTRALIDSEANSFAFIDTTFLKYLSPFFKPILHLLKTPFIKDPKITYYTLLNLIVDNYIQSFTSFLITYLGLHSLAENRILVDCTKRRLYWPKDIPRTTTYTRNIPIQLQGDQAYIKKQPTDLNLLLLDNSNSLSIAPLIYFALPGRLNPALSSSIPAYKIAILKKTLKGETINSVVQINKLDTIYIKPQAKRKPVAVKIKSISSTVLNLIYKKYSNYELFSVTLQEIDSLIDQ